VGDEQYYSNFQKLIIANIVSVMVLLRVAAGNATAAGSRAIKKAKAGAAEVEYEQLNLNTTLLVGMNTASMVNLYTNKAITLAAQSGCFFTFTTEGALDFTPYYVTKPFINFQDCESCSG
jgi:hypothetical protein